MKIYQSRLFEKKIKDFNSHQKKSLDGIIMAIAGNPNIGQEKKGDLRRVFIYKFKLQNQLYLLAYRFPDLETLELIMIGPHENYYRDLKNYLKNKA